MKLVPVATKVGDHCFRGLLSYMSFRCYMLFLNATRHIMESKFSKTVSKTNQTICSLLQFTP